MSAIFGAKTFEDRLSVAFRGDVKEQKTAIQDLRREQQRRGPIGGLGASGLFGREVPKSRLGAGSGNVFKGNLGGTQRLTR